jgi:transposase
VSNKILTVKPEKIDIPVNYPRSRLPEEKDVAHLLEVEPHHRIVTANGGKVLVDGAHRRLAAILDERGSVEVVDLGKLSEAEILKESVKRNATHGKQLTLSEKAKAAKSMVGDLKVVELADLFAVSTRTVSRWVSEEKELARVNAVAKAIRLLDKGWSLSKIAKELGVARSTLQGWLDKAEGEADAVDPTPPPKASTASSEKSKASGGSGQAATGSGKSTTSIPAPSEEYQAKYDDLLDETKDAIAMMSTAIMGDIKSVIKESGNPDGLHWAEFARFVMTEIVEKFPKEFAS